MKKTGIYIGRFQPWHIGHTDALRQIFSECNQVYILLGSIQESRSQKNPWTPKERIEIIQKSIPSKDREKIKFYEIEDHPDDDVWFEKLQEILPENATIYSGNPWVLDICKQQNYPHKEINLNINVCATEIRSELKKGNDTQETTIVKSLPK